MNLHFHVECLRCATGTRLHIDSLSTSNFTPYVVNVIDLFLKAAFACFNCSDARSCSAEHSAVSGILSLSEFFQKGTCRLIMNRLQNKMQNRTEVQMDRCMQKAVHKILLDYMKNC